uniref:aldehyde dehydrogenase family protein n=1 Tax=Mycolicibacterium bacteremicum TaxID=564198 RepID=UPI003F5855D6
MTANVHQALDIVEPATGKPLQALPPTDPLTLCARIANARAARQRWVALGTSQRRSVMLGVAEGIQRDADDLATLESRNAGKPIEQARAEIHAAAAAFQYYAGAIDKHTGQTFAADNALHYTLRQPIGIVAAIVPWNFPLLLATWKIAPAIAAGNAILVKPSELTPLTAQLLEGICHAAGVPRDLIQVLFGGPLLGRALVDHPDIRKISFTGSTSVGAEIAQRSAHRFKRLTLELGGKAANIIFADAAVEKALQTAVSACFDNNGQDCCSRARILVERPIYERALDVLGDQIRALRVGPPTEAETDVGPLISEDQRASVMRRVESALAEGARIETGGSRIDGDGFYMTPTLISNLNPSMSIMREEIFGPVALLHPFDSEAEALAVANDTEYGLATSVWTSDSARANRMGVQLEVGMVSINSNNAVHLGAPFGGLKNSGLGRELGMAAMDSYTELKTIYHSQ